MTTGSCCCGADGLSVLKNSRQGASGSRICARCRLLVRDDVGKVSHISHSPRFPGLMVRDGACAPPHHEDLAAPPPITTHPEEPRQRRLEGWATIKLQTQ